MFSLLQKRPFVQGESTFGTVVQEVALRGATESNLVINAETNYSLAAIPVHRSNIGPIADGMIMWTLII